MSLVVHTETAAFIHVTTADKKTKKKTTKNVKGTSEHPGLMHLSKAPEPVGFMAWSFA